MSVTRKHLSNRKGIALVYVVMVVLVIAAICVTISVLAGNLYSRTASVSAQQQAMILSKSVAQMFAKQYYGSSARNILVYLLKDFCPVCHSRYQYDSTEGLYKCPHCTEGTHVYKAENVSNKYVLVNCDIAVVRDSLTSSVPNVEFLRAATFKDIKLLFYLSEDRKYLYADVTVTYNGAAATTTLVMTYLGDESFDDKMYDLFTFYNIYLTEAGGASFTFTGKDEGSKYPSVCLYSDSDEVQTYYVDKDMHSEITFVGDYVLTTSGEAHNIMGNVTAYGDLTIRDNITLPEDSDDEYCNIYCSGNLTLGTPDGAAVVIERNVYCEGNVSVYDNVTFGEGKAIYSEGNVTLQNATAGKINCTNGKVTLSTSTSGAISTTGVVEANSNSTIGGTVYCGKLKLTDSSVTGNIHTQSIALQESGDEIISGDVTILMTGAATGDMRVGDMGAAGSIYVDGNLTVNRRVADHDVKIYGTVQVNGAVADPVGYPYVSHLYGSLKVDGGVNIKNGSNIYTVNYLQGLHVHKVTDPKSGSVWLNWSIPVFTTGKDEGLVGNNALTVANVGLMSGDSWGADKASVIENTLYVCDSPTIRNNRAGNFAMLTGVENAQFFGDDFETDSVSIMAGSGYQSFVCLRNATLNNVRVGSESAYYNMAVWGGTIRGEVWAHHIRMSYINADESPIIYAKTTADVAGNLSLRSVFTDTTSKYSTSYAYGVNYGGQLYATGNVAVRYGVTLTTTAQLQCAGSAYLNGTIKCKTLVGTAVGASRTYVGPCANLVGSSSALLYANGDLYTAATLGIASTRTMETYVRDDATIKGAMSIVHLATEANLIKQEAAATIKYAADEEEEDYLKGDNDIVVVCQGPGENTFDQTVGGYSVTTLYLDGTQTINDSIVNKTNPDSVWYFAASCTINGTVATLGNIILKQGVQLTVAGNMRAHMIRYVTDSTDSYLSNVAALRSIDVADAVGKTACAVSNLQIAGDLELDVVNVDCQLTDCVVGGNLYITCKRKTVTLQGCEIGKSICVGNTDDYCDLVLRNTSVGFEVEDIASDLMASALVFCNRLTMDNSFVHGSVYSNCSVPGDNGVQLTNGSSIYYSLFAHGTMVKLTGDSTLAAMSSTALPEKLRSVSAYKLNGEIGSSVGSRVNGGAIVYLIYGKDTDTKTSNTFYTDKPLATVYAAHKTKLYGDQPGMIYNRKKNYVFDSTGAAFTGSNVVVNATTVNDSNNKIKLILSDDAFSWTTTASGNVALKSMTTSSSLAGLPNWDTVIKPNMALPGVPADVNPNAVTYVSLEYNPHMMLGNTDIWNPQTIALKWVFPLFDTIWKAATAKGEQVYVNESANGDLTMSVAYHHINVWGSLQAITDELAAKWQKDFVEVYKKEFDESDAHWWDVFGFFGVSSVVAFAQALYKAAHTFFDGLYAGLTSASAVSNWAGISKDESGYYIGTDEHGRYVQNSTGTTNINAARDGKDVLVVSTQSLSTSSNAYAEMEKTPLLKKLLGMFDQSGVFIQYLKNIGFSTKLDDWRFEYNPSGVFFFESGYVPPEVFNSYSDYYHSSEARPSDSYYRSYYDGRARDELGRWYWGGAGTSSGAVSDCTWTFYTCTDPSDPYKPNSAKDLHIVLPKHTYFAWKGDSQNNVRIIGNGRVFLYLQEDTNILIAGKDMKGTYIDNVFGGLRKIEVDETGKTKYRTNADGEKVGVYLDPTGGTGTAMQPRMFIIGTGPNIHLEIRDFTVAAYVYMPNGRDYASPDEDAYTGTKYGKQYSKDNILYLSSTSEVAKDIKIYGMYVADQVSTAPELGDGFDFIADSKVKYYETEVDLSNTFIYYGNRLVTKKRDTGMYRLPEFWGYPEDMNVEDMQFYYQGLQID